MGVACQAPASLIGRLVFQLKAKGQEKGDHQFDTRLAIVKPLNVGRFIVEIDGDSAVVSRLCGCWWPMGHPHSIRSRQRMQYGEGNTLKSQDNRAGLRALPLQSMECGKVNLRRRHSFGTFLGWG